MIMARTYPDRLRPIDRVVLVIRSLSRYRSPKDVSTFHGWGRVAGLSIGLDPEVSRIHIPRKSITPPISSPSRWDFVKSPLNLNSHCMRIVCLNYEVAFIPSKYRINEVVRVCSKTQKIGTIYSSVFQMHS